MSWPASHAGARSLQELDAKDPSWRSLLPRSRHELLPSQRAHVRSASGGWELRRTSSRIPEDPSSDLCTRAPPRRRGGRGMSLVTPSAGLSFRCQHTDHDTRACDVEKLCGPSRCSSDDGRRHGLEAAAAAECGGVTVSKGKDNICWVFCRRHVLSVFAARRALLLSRSIRALPGRWSQTRSGSYLPARGGAGPTPSPPLSRAPRAQHATCREPGPSQPAAESSTMFADPASEDFVGISAPRRGVGLQMTPLGIRGCAPRRKLPKLRYS